MIPRAMGCSECASSEAALLSISSSSHAPKGRMSVTPKIPRVRVPVLSNTITWRSFARSKACRSLIRRPDFAARVVETATTSGTARPRACGQAMTMTVAIRSIAKSRLSPRRNQPKKVIAPTERAIRVRRRAARFARSCARDLLSWAFRTSSITWLR